MKEYTKEQIRELIARRAAKEIHDEDVVTLGIGLPTEVANYVDPKINVYLQSENGLLGAGKIVTDPEKIDKNVTNAGGAYVETEKGCCFYDVQMAFMMIRGGHIDVTILGALQVDKNGNLASWLIPGVFAPGIGGSMDLTRGAKRVIVAMEHTSKNQIKILEECTLPLTAAKAVDMIITERCVFKVGKEGLILVELNPDFTIDEIRESTGCDFVVAI